MNQPQDITASIASFPLPVTPRNLNKRTVRTGHYPLSANILERHNQVGESVQGVTSHPSDPSETTPSLPPDQAAWLPVARQILAGEFDGADKSTVESLTIGLRHIEHPLTRRALAWLQTHPAKA